MRTKDFRVLQERLLPSFPGFATKGPLIFVSPVAHTLRGFSFEPSSFDKKPFYVTVFFLPMCVPTKHLTFNFGHRVRKNGSGRWRVDDPGFENILIMAMQKEVSFLLGLRTPRDVANALEQLIKPIESGYVNPHTLEALAYMLIQAGETVSATKAIDTLLRRTNRSVLWEDKVASRAQFIGAMLAKRTEAAREELNSWESETVRNLGLENFK